MISQTLRTESQDTFFELKPPGALRLYQFVFFCIVFGYCFYYAPYGLNDTDGGFITGLAWQLISGKSLYTEISYVRPPLPIWLRALELKLLPDFMEIMFERNLFYLKLAFYSYTGAALLVPGATRWLIATLAFIISAHTYPAAAWHTVDGIFFSVLALSFILQMSTWHQAIAAGLLTLCAELCKQPFIIVPVLLFGAVLLFHRNRIGWISVATYLISKAIFYIVLHLNGSLDNYFLLTSGSATGSALIQHGFLDFYDVPMPLMAGALILAFGQKLGNRYAAYLPTIKLLLFGLMIAWVATLMLVYIKQVADRQDFTAPFLQSRALWWLASFWLLAQLRTHRYTSKELFAFATMIAISWASAVSWGYNLPILFALPGVFALREISTSLLPSILHIDSRRHIILHLGLVIVLLCTFRYGYEYVYHDGKRSEMHTHLGKIYPKLTGIYSNQATADKYAALHALRSKYGSNCIVLPGMTLANYLENTRPTLPLDWVVEREFGFESWTESLKKSRNAVFLVEKKLIDQINSNPEYKFTQDILHNMKVIEENEYFLVGKKPITMNYEL